MQNFFRYPNTFFKGGRTIINAKMLFGYAAAGRYGTLNDGVASYPVPTGKKLVCKAVEVHPHLGTDTDNFTVYLGYGDNDVGHNSVAAPTNASYMGDSSVSAIMGFCKNKEGFLEAPVHFEIAAGKYPFVFVETTLCDVKVFCELEDA